MAYALSLDAAEIMYADFHNDGIRNILRNPARCPRLWKSWTSAWANRPFRIRLARVYGETIVVAFGKSPGGKEENTGNASALSDRLTIGISEITETKPLKLATPATVPDSPPNDPAVPASPSCSPSSLRRR